MLIKPSQLDKIFKALSHRDRRFMIQSLCAGEAPFAQLASKMPMTMPSALQHLELLEEAGLVRSEKSGRVRTCQVDPDALDIAANWVATRKRAIRRATARRRER